MARIETSVTLESETHFFVGLPGDIRRGGIFVATHRKLEIGQPVVVELALHAYVLFVRGTVAWSSPGGEAIPTGIGVAFDDLSLPAERVIESFCVRRPPIYYEVDER